MKRPQISYELLSDVCLILLYREFIGEREGGLTPAHIQATISDVPLNVIKRTLANLEYSGHVNEITKTRREFKEGVLGSSFGRGQVYEYDAPTGSFQITDDGRKVVEKWEDAKYEDAEGAAAPGKLIQNSPRRDAQMDLASDLAATSKVDPGIPASNRYVDVKDNQPAFEELRKSLTSIKNEFALDHNKRELPIDNIDARLAEIESFEVLIDRGWVSSASAQNFMTTLKYIKSVCVDGSAIINAVGSAIAALIKIFGHA